MSAALIETCILAEAGKAATKTGRLMEVTLITPGHGSSGYYGPECLEAAAAARVIPAGTQMFVDHQTYSEQSDRVYGERSLKDYAARTTEDAIWDGERLYARVETFGPWRPILADMAEAIGVSIRARGTAEMGKVDGRDTKIVKSIDYVESVDFVPAAGRGGKIAALLESAHTRGGELVEAANVGAWFESQIHCEFTTTADRMYGDGYLTREERITLSSAIGDALKGFVSRVESDAPQLFARDRWVEPGPVAVPVTESANPKEPPVAENETGAPPAGGGSTETPATQPVDMTEAANRATARVGELESQLAEARENARLASDQSVQLAEANRRLRDANERIVRLEGAETARFAVAEAFKKADLPAVALARVTASVVGLNGNALPLVEGHVDNAKLRASIDAAILAETEYVASIATDRGAGQVRGMGATNKGGALTEAQTREGLTDIYKALGLDENEAAFAAKGRG